jgi:broad specificity phosphatase PhoE
MKVIIVRHGQTDENTKSVDIGKDSNAQLNEQGKLQAKKLGHHLKKEKIHAAYTSPQKRARDTAEGILVFQDPVDIIEIPDLREQNMGIYEGAPKQVWKQAIRDSMSLFHEFKPEKGESYGELQKRAASFFDKLLEKHENDTVLVVSHGGTLGMLYLHILGKEPTQENYSAHKPENTAVTIVEIFKDKPLKVHKLNSLEHLL